MEEKKPRNPTTWQDVASIAIVCFSVLGAIALLVWGFK